MRQFSGCEPLVGEIVGLRTFRVDESGLLLPLYSNDAWCDGANVATCAPPAGGHRRPHPVVAPDCECGFYAYGTERAAGRTRQMRYVQAIVSCWGRVVAGTLGVRAEYARIDALWLGERVPKWVRVRIAHRYPSARLYTSREAMLAEHPLSRLPSYEPLPRPSHLEQLGVGAAATAVLAFGALPRAWLAGPALVAWWVLVGWLLAMVVATAAMRQRAGRSAAIWLLAVALGWLVAPMCGVSGWLLRLPVLRAAVITSGRFLLALRPGYFPVVPVQRARTFCGVRP